MPRRAMPNRIRILIVEDDPQTMTMLFSALTSHKWAVLAADGGQHAIDLLERGIRPSVIVIDLHTPRVSGAQLTEYLHTDPELRLIPIVVLTDAVKAGARVVADVVLEKPIDVPRLLRTIRRLSVRPYPRLSH
jgi:CheY-like chemotaxis protein